VTPFTGRTAGSRDHACYADTILRLVEVAVRGFILIGLCGLVLGCASDRMGTRLATWQGSHYSEVTAQWGQPSECAVIDSQRICKWQVRPTVMKAREMSLGVHACETILAFDDEGVVTGWRWRGDRCQQNATAVVAYSDQERPDAFSLEANDESASDVASTDLSAR
jgi:hypothetical protein